MAKKEISAVKQSEFRAAVRFARDAVCMRWRSDIDYAKDGKELAEKVLTALETGKNVDAALSVLCFFWYADSEPDNKILDNFVEDIQIEGVLSGYSDFAPLPYFDAISVEQGYMASCRILCGKLHHDLRVFTEKDANGISKQAKLF
jgi:hypothetical protein